MRRRSTSAHRRAGDSRGAERRPDGLPGVEVVHAPERRQVVTKRRLHQFGDLRLLRDKEQKILCRSLVLREAPQAIKLRQLPDEAALGATRHRMRPAILRHFGVVALGDRPGARRVHDARALAGDEPAVVAGIVPGVNVGRNHSHQLLGIFEHCARLVGIDLDVVLGVDHDDTMGVEQRANPVNGVACLAHRQADGIAGFE